MERAIIHSDLKKQEIQPEYLLYNYLDLLGKDIKKMLPKDFWSISQFSMGSSDILSGSSCTLKLYSTSPRRPLLPIENCEN